MPEVLAISLDLLNQLYLSPENISAFLAYHYKCISVLSPP